MKKAKPLFSFSKGLLADSTGNAFPVNAAEISGSPSFFSKDCAESAIAVLAARGVNLLLLRVELSRIAAQPNSFDEAFLARLREVLKEAEKMRVGIVLSIEERPEPSGGGGLFIDAAEHAARRAKDCAALLGLAVKEGSGMEFLSDLAARIEKRNPSLIFFIEPQAGGFQAQGCKGAPDCPAPFVSPEFWPRAWL